MHTEDIKFLMRKDKVASRNISVNWIRCSRISTTFSLFCFSQEKLKKLNLYLSFKESKQKLVKQVSQDDEEILGNFGKAAPNFIVKVGFQ